jgi:hypothetical protein
VQNIAKTASALCVAVLLAGCAGMSDTQQRAVTGTAAGAAGGALIGAIAGNTGMGAVIGAGAGLATGLVVDKVQKDKDAAYRRGVADGRSGG